MKPRHSSSLAEVLRFWGKEDCCQGPDVAVCRGDFLEDLLPVVTFPLSEFVNFLGRQELGVPDLWKAELFS